MSTTTPTNPEAQPLLSVAEQPRYHDHEPATTSGISDEESTLVADAPKARSLSMIAFQTVIVFLSLILVGLFVKGFIDADDAEVWLYLEWRSRTRFSLVVDPVRLGRGSQERARWRS